MKNIVLTIFILVLAFGLGIGSVRWADWQQSSMLAQANVQLFKQGLTITDGQFLDQTGQTRQLSDWHGKRVLMFFGFTFCPDVCPMTLSDLSRTWRQLPAAWRDQWQVVMVSVDPERDTPEMLAPYMAYFNQNFIALTGNADALKRLAGEVNALYSRVEGQDGRPYLMDHTANLVVLDQHGRYRGYLAPPFTPATLVNHLLMVHDRL